MKFNKRHGLIKTRKVEENFAEKPVYHISMFLWFLGKLSFHSKGNDAWLLVINW